MQSERQQQQSWRVHVTAKANNSFNFRLRFAAITPTYKPTWNFSFFRIYILLKLPKFALSITSHPTHGRGFLTSKFVKILRKLRPRFTKKKKKEPNVPFPKEPVCVGFGVVGFLACLAQSMNKYGHRGILMLASVGSLLLLFRKLKIAKLVILVAIFLVVVGTMFYYQFIKSDYSYNNYWEYMGRSWNKMVRL